MPLGNVHLLSMYIIETVASLTYCTFADSSFPCNRKSLKLTTNALSLRLNVRVVVLNIIQVTPPIFVYQYI